ncbi:class I SAM-dependent methyltransferase [Streptomyces sp. NPDC059916]|uniref:class I SAM-dependent methyltransferase n=1 Tax=Streptomyces sp. NPDC059916 TaxID=3347001 RepID=UPI0036C5B732
MTEEREPLLLTMPILEATRGAGGSLTDPEADLLVSATSETIRACPVPHRVLVVGTPGGRLLSVLDLVLRQLGHRREPVHVASYPQEPDAGTPIGMLVVDGLSDCASVVGGVTQAEQRLLPSGLLAMHAGGDDHAGYRSALELLQADGCYELLCQVEALTILRKVSSPGVPPLGPLVERIDRAEGWMTRDEAAALGWVTARALARSCPGAVVEIGAWCGRATGVLAGVVQAVGACGPVHSIDPFDGLTGAVGEQLWQLEPTRERFEESLRTFGIEGVVRLHNCATGELRWRAPISLLLVDGLHDYASSAQDLRSMEPHLKNNALVLFRNYTSEYWPGVTTLVDEIVASGRYSWRSLTGTLAVLEHHGGAPRSPRPRPRCAVVTMVNNEAFFLPIWLDYYHRYFDADDVYVLDHDTTDGSTDRDGFVRIPVHNPVTDWAWHRDMLQKQQHRLLAHGYDQVLVTDTDEIVIPDPVYGSLDDYLRQMTGEFVNCRGYEIIHDVGTEPAFDLQRPVLDQRQWWFRNPVYSKPLLARVPMDWSGGFHTRSDGRVLDDPRLFLVHLHRVDFDRCLERHRQRLSRPWVQHQVDAGWGYQERIVEPTGFERWFTTDTCQPGWPLRKERIPRRWSGAF